MYQRSIELSKIIEKKSLLLLGPRQVGKSTLIRSTLAQAPTFNLLDAGLYRSLSADPTRLRREVLAIHPKPKLVVIDEIQRLPELLNEAQLMMDDHGLRFVLTGSSARALKRKGINLLGGRARVVFMHPLTSQELGEAFDLERAVNHGLLPPMYDSTSPDEDLRDYAGVYLREEVAAEGLARDVPAFSRFLEVAAACNGQILNYSKIASDAEVKRSTVIDYFQVLRDTLLAFELPAWGRTTKRKPITASKHYLFDPGVARHLANHSAIKTRSPVFGAAFEHLVFRELRTAIDYGYGKSLHYWRSTTGLEVDFIFDEAVAIEVKAASTHRAEDLKGLRALREEHPKLKLILVSTADRAQKDRDVLILPWAEFFRRLWRRELNE